MSAKPLTAAAAIASAHQRASAAAQTVSSTVSSPASAAKPSAPSHFTELEPEVPVEAVKLDGLAVMKIIKHAREAHAGGAAASAGQLLGLDAAGTLSVSDVFALPQGSLLGASAGAAGDGEESKGIKAAGRYTAAILPRLSALGSDANLVGFYTSTANGQHLATPGFLDALISVQLGPSSAAASAGAGAKSGGVIKKPAAAPAKTAKVGKGVAVVYDVASAGQGVVGLKAFRLSKEFVEAHKGGKYDSQALIEAKLLPTNILTELPLTIQSSALLTAFLSTLSVPSTPLPPAHTAPSASSAASIPSYARPQIRTSALSATHFAPLALPSSSDADAPAPLADTLAALIASMDVHNTALSTLSFQSRQLARDRGRLEGVVQRRLEENERRKEKGLPALPPSAEEAALQEPSRLETMCALSGVEGAAKTLTEVSGTGLVRAYGAKAGVSV